MTDAPLGTTSSGSGSGSLNCGRGGGSESGTETGLGVRSPGAGEEALLREIVPSTRDKGRIPRWSPGAGEEALLCERCTSA
jgi:hypothetical protein